MKIGGAIPQETSASVVTGPYRFGRDLLGGQGNLGGNSWDAPPAGNHPEIAGAVDAVKYCAQPRLKGAGRAKIRVPHEPIGGLEEVINSSIGTGANKPISPTQLDRALGRETVDDPSQKTGILLSQLSATS